MHTELTLLVALVLNVPAQGAAQQLWQDLTVGMPKATVEARYPKKLVNLTPDCAAKANFEYSGGLLRKVTLSMGGGLAKGRSTWDRENACRGIVMSSIVEKYGPNDLVSTQPVDAFALKTAPYLKPSIIYQWTKTPVLITLKIDANNNY